MQYTNKSTGSNSMFFLGPRPLSTPLLSATFEKSEARGAGWHRYRYLCLKKPIWTIIDQFHWRVQKSLERACNLKMRNCFFSSAASRAQLMHAEESSRTRLHWCGTDWLFLSLGRLGYGHYTSFLSLYVSFLKCDLSYKECIRLCCLGQFVL